MAKDTPKTVRSADADSTTDDRIRVSAKRAAENAENATAAAAEAGKLPETSAITNPAPATNMESLSGAFIEQEIKQAIDVDHPAVDNNPRAGTSAVQNGIDWNDPAGRRPEDRDFVGQGIDPTPYGDGLKR